MIRGWHAHVYFSKPEAEAARSLCEAARDALGVPMGRVHVDPVGPHPRGSCQLSLRREQFTPAIEWFLAHRGDFTVMIHGLSGDDLIDHTRYIFWLGASEALDLTQLH